ncbi:hypothetical protein SBD_2888 [Streptomyces bottropensis ATCC 25435]|uniref:Uncharacterized protein n=1 Tax=Streptomyces bottropensis ATCC 25435 TaxID=1054862 RepID=M3FRG7_9ACTN|nr:hypothetical protein SBD_2888 [Streptomyces bottropensis ATCC 25435]
MGIPALMAADRPQFLLAGELLRNEQITGVRSACRRRLDGESGDTHVRSPLLPVVSFGVSSLWSFRLSGCFVALVGLVGLVALVASFLLAS